MTEETDHESTEALNLQVEDENKLTTDSRLNTEILEMTIEDVKNKKVTLSSTMDSVISLMKEVELREKEAEEAVEKIGQSSLSTLAKVDELKQAHQIANETNQKRAKIIDAERDLLAAKMDRLQSNFTELLDLEDTSVADLDEICRSLEIRLGTALAKKEEAEKENINLELSAQKALEYQERQHANTVQANERLKTEALKNFAMSSFISQGRDAYNVLSKEISRKDVEVKQLKVKLDLPGDLT